MHRVETADAIGVPTVSPAFLSLLHGYRF